MVKYGIMDGHRGVYLYILTDPRDGIVRYAGSSVNPLKRLAARLANPAKSLKAWIAGLIAANALPLLTIIRRVDWGSRDVAESQLIAEHAATALNHRSACHILAAQCARDVVITRKRIEKEAIPPSPFARPVKHHKRKTLDKALPTP